jgi:hypothetical protein
MTAPGALNYVPRTIFDDPDPVARSTLAHFYGQIVWFTGAQGTPVRRRGRGAVRRRAKLGSDQYGS